jgi:hypothetical protein
VNPRNLSAMAFGLGITWWAYRTDFPDSITRTDYFDEMSNTLSVGDIIIASGNNGAVMRVVTFVVDKDGARCVRTARFIA